MKRRRLRLVSQPVKRLPPAKGECGVGWADRCARATGHVCKCHCGGANHGRHRESDQTELFTEERHA